MGKRISNIYSRIPYEYLGAHVYHGNPSDLSYRLTPMRTLVYMIVVAGDIWGQHMQVCSSDCDIDSM